MQVAFEEVLAAVSVDRLTVFEGIAGGTVGKLREYGITHLGQLVRSRLNIPGIGEKRAGDIRAAQEQLVAEAHERFVRGDTSARRDLDAAFAAIDRRAEQDLRSCQAREGAAAAILDHLRQIGP